MGQVCDERKVNDERGYHVRVEFFSTHSFFLARKNVFFFAISSAKCMENGVLLFSRRQDAPFSRGVADR